MRTCAIVLVAAFLSGCAAPTAQEIKVTRIVEVTRVVEADCPKCTDCPACPTYHAAQPCLTQAAAAPATGEVVAPKDAGSYLVGTEMAPGIWRSSGTGEHCFLMIKNLAGDMETISGDPPGGTIRIPSGEYIVVVETLGGDCTWEYLQP